MRFNVNYVLFLLACAPAAFEAVTAVPLESRPISSLSLPRTSNLDTRGGFSFLTGSSSKSSSSSKGKGKGKGSGDSSKKTPSTKETSTALTMQPWRRNVDDEKTAWKAGPINPSGLMSAELECESLASRSYRQLNRKPGIARQENLVVACLYIPNGGYFLSSQWMDGARAVPPRDSAPAWKDAVYGRTPRRTQTRWDAEDMSCILAEKTLGEERNWRLQPGQQYPEGSLVRVYGRFGVHGTLHIFDISHEIRLLYSFGFIYNQETKPKYNTCSTMPSRSPL